MDHSERQMQFVFQLRSQGVTNVRVLNAMEAVAREAFVEGIFQDRAYEDVALPISSGQTISSPSVVGMMTQALDVGPRDKVLEIGTGSGYQAAILAKLARRVYTVERYKDLARSADARLNAMDANNVVVLHRDGTHGLPDQSPFDRILVTAAGEDVPAPLLKQLRSGGALVMPVGGVGETQTLIKVVKSDEGLEYNALTDVRFVPLIAGLPQEMDV